VTPACNPSYSGGSDQEDRGSKPAWASSSPDPILKKTLQKKKKKGLVEWLKVKALSSSPRTAKRKRKKKEIAKQTLSLKF
jgi:ribosomal protein S19E (S16A)